MKRLMRAREHARAGVNAVCYRFWSGRLEVKSKNYDIVRKDDQQLAIWLETVPDLVTARSRIQQLVAFWPGEFCVMDQQSHHIVARVNDRASLPVSTVEHHRVE
jgi:hypothetical protein